MTNIKEEKTSNGSSVAAATLSLSAHFMKGLWTKYPFSISAHFVEGTGSIDTEKIQTGNKKGILLCNDTYIQRKPFYFADFKGEITNQGIK